MPSLLYFNPGCELEVASGNPKYSLQKYPALLERDLASLPMLMSQPGDVVAASTADSEFERFWSQRFQCRMLPMGCKEMRAMLFHEYRPWGISPRAMRMAEGLNFAPEYMSRPSSAFSDRHRLLFSRETSAAMFGQMAQAAGYPTCCTGEDCLPRIMRDTRQVEEMAREARGRDFEGIVLKAIYGSSGRGIRMIRHAAPSSSDLAWAKAMIKSQGCIECEFLLSKASDFSMQYDIADGKAKFRGASLFSANSFGAYERSLAGGISEIPGLSYVSISQLAAMHIRALQNSEYCKIYHGPLGIDCMTYSRMGSMMLNPCVEVNCRHSMGRLALELGPLISDGSQAYFHVFRKDMAGAEFSENPQFSNGKLMSGFLTVTPRDTQAFAAGISARRI